MKKKTTSKKRNVAVRKNASVMFEEPTLPETMPAAPAVAPSPRRLNWPMIIVTLLVIVMLGLIAMNRGMLFAAIVNGQPIFRWNLNEILAKRYGQQTLDGMITEQLVETEAQKAGITVSQTDIDTRAKEILSSFGSNLTVDDFLRLQGMQKSDFDNQIRLQLVVQRLLSKDLSITDTDIDQYIASNRAMLVSTEEGQLREEAKKAMLDQKVAERFDTWLQEIRAKASIRKFL